jgi:hypothetical protein
MNLVSRIFEHVEGMLACVATRCPTSSEALGRVVVEGSVNLMHMSQFGHEKAIIAFFESWINEHERKLNRWKEIIKDKEYSNSVSDQIDQRKKLIEYHRICVNEIVTDFSIDRNDFSTIWPKTLFDRFKNIDREEFYYAHYHRLSGASHVTAEDTISWLISLNLDHKQQHNIAHEAVYYSIMMARLSSIFFIDAVAVCCISHGLQIGEVLDRFTELKENLLISVDDIAEAAGVPQGSK